jgi:PadR family transcriptional regulator PadR
MRSGARAARCRRPSGPGWRVRARVERFSEPALLLLLRQRPAHGYELLESLAEFLPGERIDMGNLYRALRALERDGLVSSDWRAEAPGPARRVYALTDPGARVLDEWAGALERARGQIDIFLSRYETGRR